MRRRTYSLVTPAAFLLVGAAFCVAAETEKPIELSAGVALPQTLPEGAVLSFGAHYHFREGEPAKAKYFFVVDRSDGAPGKQEVKLAKSGMLAVIFRGWKSEQGPFYGHLEDAQGKEVSNTVELKGVGE